MAKLQNVIVIGAKFGTGTSTKSGSPKPYQFANVSYLKMAESFQNEQHNIQMAGYDVQELSTLFDGALFERFKSQCPFGQPVHLLLDADPQNPSRNIVVDFELVK
jgi:hypothetical protein